MGKLVNILGRSHSGTTLMDLILGNDARGFSSGEMGAWFRPFRPHHALLRCACGEEPCAVWHILAELKASEFHVGVCKYLDKDFVVDSSKDLEWVIDAHTWALKSGMQVYNVLVWKMPSSLAWSSYKRTGQAMAWRRSFVYYYRRFLELDVPFVSLCYDDFVAHPAQTLSRLCELTDVPYFDGKEQYWNTKHHHLFGSKSARKSLHSKQGRIEPAVTWPEDLNDVEAEVKEQVTSDRELQDLVSHLQAYDVMTVSRNICSDRSLRHPYPSWYYANRLKRAYKQWHLSS